MPAVWFSFRLPLGLAKALAKQAQASGRSAKQQLLFILKQALEVGNER